MLWVRLENVFSSNFGDDDSDDLGCEGIREVEHINMRLGVVLSYRNELLQTYWCSQTRSKSFWCQWTPASGGV